MGGLVLVGVGAGVDVLSLVLSLESLAVGRRFRVGRSLSSPLSFFEGSVSSSIGVVELGFRRRVGLLGSTEDALSGRF